MTEARTAKLLGERSPICAKRASPGLDLVVRRPSGSIGLVPGCRLPQIGVGLSLSLTGFGMAGDILPHPQADPPEPPVCSCEHGGRG